MWQTLTVVICVGQVRYQANCYLIQFALQNQIPKQDALDCLQNVFEACFNDNDYLLLALEKLTCNVRLVSVMEGHYILILSCTYYNK